MSFLIRTSPDQRSFASFPELIAGYHVLRRFSMPRHPPCTLKSLTTFTGRRRYCCQRNCPPGVSFPGADPQGVRVGTGAGRVRETHAPRRAGTVSLSPKKVLDDTRRARPTLKAGPQTERPTNHYSRRAGRGSPCTPTLRRVPWRSTLLVDLEPQNSFTCQRATTLARVVRCLTEPVRRTTGPKRVRARTRVTGLPPVTRSINQVDSREPAVRPRRRGRPPRPPPAGCPGGGVGGRGRADVHRRIAPADVLSDPLERR